MADITIEREDTGLKNEETRGTTYLITPLINVMESSDPKLEQAIAGTWGKYVGRSIM